MSHKAYLISSPGLPRDHHALYIAPTTNIEESNGYIYQVTGTIQTGMTTNHKPITTTTTTTQSLTAEGITNLQYLGTISSIDFHSGKVKEVVDSIAVPEKQFDGARRLDSSRPLRRCQEWTREVVEKLRDFGTLKSDEVVEEDIGYVI